MERYGFRRVAQASFMKRQRLSESGSSGPAFAERLGKRKRSVFEAAENQSKRAARDAGALGSLAWATGGEGRRRGYDRYSGEGA